MGACGSKESAAAVAAAAAADAIPPPPPPPVVDSGYGRQGSQNHQQQNQQNQNQQYNARGSAAGGTGGPGGSRAPRGERSTTGGGSIGSNRNFGAAGGAGAGAGGGAGTVSRHSASSDPGGALPRNSSRGGGAGGRGKSGPQQQQQQQQQQQAGPKRASVATDGGTGSSSVIINSGKPPLTSDPGRKRRSSSEHPGTTAAAATPTATATAATSVAVPPSTPPPPPPPPPPPGSALSKLIGNGKSGSSGSSNNGRGPSASSSSHASPADLDSAPSSARGSDSRANNDKELRQQSGQSGSGSGGGGGRKWGVPKRLSATLPALPAIPAMPRVGSKVDMLNGSLHGNNSNTGAVAAAAAAAGGGSGSGGSGAAAGEAMRTRGIKPAEPYSIAKPNPTWSRLCATYRPLLSDPADVRSILDEAVSDVVNLLSPVEVTLIQRRVRDVVRGVTNPGGSGSGGGGGGSGGGSGGGGGGGNNAKTKSSSKSKSKSALGRLAGGGSKHRPSDQDERSRQTYQKENVLDENLIRQVFVGGERVLARVCDNDVAKTSRAVYVRRRGSGRSAPLSLSTASGASGGAGAGFNGGGTTGIGNASLPLPVSPGRSRRGQHGSHNPDSPYDAASADPVGSAHVLMLHMAERRWDRVAAVAKLSADRAGLEMDVNKATATAEHKTKQKKSPRSSAAEAAPPPPPAPQFTKFLVDAYGDAGAAATAALGTSPTLPGGTSTTSLCFLIALALRGSRSQRLNLLYYILLPPDQLRELLDGHCAGGVPTWLLEPGTENSSIVSYASLSHYYYYGGGLVTSSSATDGAVPPGRLVLSASRAIGCIASLLMDALGAEKTGSGTSDHAASGATDDGSNGTSRKGSVLARSLAECRENKPKSVRRGVAIDVKEAMMDQFWSNSYALFDNAENADVYWSPDDFITWAENALCGKLSRKVGHDVVLEMITHRLFGTGILPTPGMERTLVSDAWVSWQRMDGKIATAAGPNGDGDGSWDDYLCNIGETLRGYLEDGSQDSGASGPPPPAKRPWGGIGGIDGWGGLGRGIMYCIDRKWWDEWSAYVGWTWGDEDSSHKSSKMRSRRPNEISTEPLLANTSSTWTSCPSGTLGSYEYMISDLARGKDYVLVPCAVWDLFYELYGGGPPLPRMVLPPTIENGAGRGKGNVINSVVTDELSSGVEVVAEHRDSKPMRIPPQVNVATHPWILHCHICDPHQPYRRGDAGPLSIRIMATPDQSLWRLFGEIVTRLPVSHPKARDASGLGRGRLWKHSDLPSASGANGSDSTPAGGRYGPWMLLCKNRSACFPTGGGGFTGPDLVEMMRTDWLDYTDNGSVESSGLSDGTRIMFEYALMAKDGKFAWPREAAAKAGRVRQLADEDAAFRLTLRGLDSEGKLIAGTPAMLGKNVDAMDISGRWYKRKILQVDTQDHTEGDGDEDEEEDVAGKSDFIPGEVRAVRVDFTDCGGHEEWIDVRSDRLAVVGRFSVDSDLDSTHDEGEETKGATGTNKLGAKEPSSSELVAAGKVCSFPGYGACGLANLGNTCYANAALECISYTPLLRSYLLSGQYKVSGHLNKDNPLGTGGKVLEEFADLLRVMQSGKYGVRAPSKLKNQLAKARSQYAGADQQDSQELLNDMLDCLHEDSNKVVKKPYVEAPEDDWVKHTGLPRVGLEAWRRFLRRNQSAIADVAMGQVLNRVTCPKCKHESRNFDPFNMLSIPFPTVAEVIFRCRVVRRGTSLNCPGTLGRPKHSDEGESGSRSAPSPPSGKLIIEEYVIPMSRLADVGDLRLRLQNISGIPASRMKLCKKNEIVSKAASQSNDPSRIYFGVTPLPEKEGPCIQLARQLSGTKVNQTAEDIARPSITSIIAFESTLRARPEVLDAGDKGNNNEELTDDETADEDEDDAIGDKEYQRSVAKMLHIYGDKDECRLYDTNPTALSKAMSRALWPKSAANFRIGLRVDAIDHRSHWFPGSVVEIIEPSKDADVVTESPEAEGKGDDDAADKTKVKVHFDNFSSKWDETYTIEQFKKGRVRPLYSHANHKAKPTEFLIHHRHKIKSGNSYNALFGQPFYLQCHNEWSSARAGAHILAQASRFLQDNEGTRREPSDQFYQSSENARAVITQIIDVLLDFDRKYAESALKPIVDRNSDGIRRSTSAAVMSQKLSKKLNMLLPLLPFDVRVCANDSPLGGQQGSSAEECAFPFSLLRTMGNYMNARHAVVLHWREKETSKNTERPRHPLLYVNPEVGIHERSKGVLEADAAAKAAASSGKAHGGVQLGVCLDEFCKEQHLPETDSWRCPNCKEIREGNQHMVLWRLPDILVFHLKRFNCSARWREKITTKVNFPLTGLNMSEWCDKDSPFLQGPDESYVYDLFGVVNHYGGMTGGHYVSTCKATPCGADGSEEVAYNFSGPGVSEIDAEEETTQSVWKGLGRSKEKDAASASTKAATAAARFVAESSEPVWLQFDDDLVDPIPPKHVVSEMAYVLFYRRRRLSPSNVAKYSTLE